MAAPILLAPHDPPELFKPGLKTSVPWDDNRLVLSPKINGNRCLCVAGNLYTRSLKAPKNVELPDYLADLQSLTADLGLVVDMELCDPTASHHGAFSGIIDSYHLPIPEGTKAYIFDAMTTGDWEDQCFGVPYGERINEIQATVERLNDPKYVALPQRPVSNGHEVMDLFGQDIANGDEGSMLRTLDVVNRGGKLCGGFYKHGRATPLQQVIWKIKNNLTVDGQIVEVKQRRKMKEGLERTEDAFGRMERINNRDAYDLDDSVGSFVVAVSCNQLGVHSSDASSCHVLTEIVFGRGFNLDKRRDLWKRHVDDSTAFIGRWVELQHTPHGGKAVEDGGTLKGAKLLRFRPDKDNSQGREITTTPWSER
jgi:hypothetical protein